MSDAVDRTHLRSIKVIRALVVIGCVVVLLGIGLLGGLLYEIRHQANVNGQLNTEVKQLQQRNQRTTEHVRANTAQLKRVVEQLRDCVTRDGRCYKQGEAQDAAQVGAINAATIAAAACMDKPGVQSQVEVRQCVGRQLVRLD